MAFTLSLKVYTLHMHTKAVGTADPTQIPVSAINRRKLCADQGSGHDY